MNPLLPFSSIISKGYPGIVELTPRREGDPQSGSRTVRRFQGPENALLSLVPSIQSAKGRWSLADQNNNPLAWILEVSFPDLQDGSDPDDPAQITTLWFFDMEDLLIPLPNTSKWAAMTSAQKDAMKTYLADNKSANDPTVMALAFNADGLAIAAAIKAGEESVRHYRIVVRRTMSISQDNTKVFMTNVNKKYTTAALIAAESIPTPIATDMPTGEWLYKGSKKEQQPNGRFQVTSEWAHAPVWATVFYPAAT